MKPANLETRQATDSESLANIDIREKGRDEDGNSISLDRRLFMQFMAFGNCHDPEAVIAKLTATSAKAVLYQDVNDPLGVGLLSYCEDPAYLVNEIQPLFLLAELRDLQIKPEYTMLGRTYSIGYESDLEDVLIDRPIRRVLDPGTPWAVWYPVRRKGAFERQPKEEQRKMLMEHGGIGFAYGKAGYATDIRLSGHGLNKDDHDFIIGLLGKDLFPLSALVQHMRRTRQTSEYIDGMGPFFIGRAIWQSGEPLKVVSDD